MSEPSAAAEHALRSSRWPERVTLRDGSEVEIRPVRPTDKQLLRDGFARLSAESRYRRFLVPMPRLSAPLVRYLTEVDHHDHEALGALEAGSGVPIGIARYVRSEHSSDAAEVAVAVVDDWHGRGVATALLTRLAERAREEGIARFTATCQAGNAEALELVGDLGATRTTSTEGGLVEAQVELPDVDERSLSDLLRAAARKRLVFRPRWPPEGG
jgi:GNAT superfamily N-acetyltransferase